MKIEISLIGNKLNKPHDRIENLLQNEAQTQINMLKIYGHSIYKQTPQVRIGGGNSEGQNLKNHIDQIVPKTQHMATDSGVATDSVCICVT